MAGKIKVSFIWKVCAVVNWCLHRLMNISSSVIFTEWNCFLVETFIIGAINSVNRRLEWSTACKREEIREIQFVAVFKFFLSFTIKLESGTWQIYNLNQWETGVNLKECLLVWQRQNAENVWRVLHNKADRTWHWLGSESNKTITENDFVECILCKNRQGRGPGIPLVLHVFM